MFSRIILSFFLLIGVGSALAQPDPCTAGQSYWCQNIDTATECGVLAYCKLRNPKLDEQQKKIVNDAVPVIVELYYESFCGGCQEFMIKQLYPAYQKLYSTGIFQIGLYPYGNAEEKQNPDGTYHFDCQHGEIECEVNMIETCAIHTLHDNAAFMPYIHCVENEPSPPAAMACAEALKVDWETISNCVNGTMGNKLEHEMGVKTNALSPSHWFVPWITVNNQHTTDIQDKATKDLISLICDTYTGVKPHACRVHKKQQERCMKN